MKQNQLNTLAGTGIIIAAILGIWWFAARKTAIASPAAAIKAAVTASATPVRETLRIPANYNQSFTFSPAASKLPGRLYGQWTCRGKTANISGAHDDTLVSYRL